MATGWFFLTIVFVLMVLFAVSVLVSARKQQDPNFFLEDDK